ncbi:MAG: hypothetical protein M3347_09335 [Armatimonadota bacterium]|nr:hypothetical protein [Armatimonadota bacterium]
MKVADLSSETLDKIRKRRYDRIIEKHEGPFDWESEIKYDSAEFLQVAGHWVLLPREPEHHPNITILRCIESKDGNSLTIFLKDTTFVDSPQDEFFMAGFVAVCDKVPEENFYITIVYHEWFIIESQ